MPVMLYGPKPLSLASNLSKLTLIVEGDYSLGMLKILENKSASTIGLLQALGITIYCGLISIFFNFMTKTTAKPEIFGFFLILNLLVFSAAVTGSIVFGFPAYLAVVKNKIKEALTILAFTALYALAIILITITLILALY